MLYTCTYLYVYPAVCFIYIYMYIYTVSYICFLYISGLCVVVSSVRRVGDGRVGVWVGGSVSGWTLGVWVCGYVYGV
jgi:hypothetical protein